MTETIIIIILFTIAAALASFASYLYGLNQIKAKMIVEAKRREKRLDINLQTWQNAYVRTKGGHLKPPPEKPPSDAKARRISSPSEVIGEIKEKKSVLSVPKAIEQEFLADAKTFAR